MENQTTPKYSEQITQATGAFTAFGVPSKIVVNGREIIANKIDLAIHIFGRFPASIKSFAITRIGGFVKLYIKTYTLKERTLLYKNPHGVDVESYCTRNACMDCKYFNHIHLVEINRNCPLFPLKENALDNGYAEIMLNLLGAVKC